MRITMPLVSFLTASVALSANSVSIYYIFNNVDVLSTTNVKAAISLFLLYSAVSYGYHYKSMHVPYIFTFLFIISFVQDINVTTSLLSFIGIVFPISLIYVSWPDKYKIKLIKIISFLPIINILIGLFLEIIGTYDLFRHGIPISRLQGAAIPAHLAMLGVVSIITSSYLYLKGNTKYIFVSIISFAIVVLTLTRLPILLSTIILGYIFVKYFKSNLNSKNKFYASLLSISCIVVLLLIFLPEIISRFQTHRAIGEYINSSGRFYAWSYFYNIAVNKLFFGHGLGSYLTYELTGVLRFFSSPHNEYLRIFYDCGSIGLILVLSSFFLTYKYIVDHTNETKFLKLIFFIFIIYSFFDNTLTTYQFSVPFFMFLGLIKNNFPCPIAKHF